MKAERKLVGMSVDLHGELSRLSEIERIPMTTLIQVMLEDSEGKDWSAAREAYKQNRQTWPNMRKRIAECKEINPDVTDLELVSLTGFSIGQVEVITYTAHKRALSVLLTQPNLTSAQLAKASHTTTTFAKRIWDQAHGEKKVTPDEQFLWDMTTVPPTPLAIHNVVVELL